MSEQPNSVDLIRLIQDYLIPHESSSPGVREVLAGIRRHLANPGSILSANPVLPQDREELLSQSLASITEPSLQPIAQILRRAHNALTWRVDYGLFYPKEADVGEGYLNGNMHTELIGPNGCVYRDDDFSLGIFMLSPATLYRDHDHAAPELYLNLTGPCGWRFNQGNWQDFDAGSIIWNPNGLAHAMRAYEQPFLSVYSWTENVNSLCRVVPTNDWQKIEAQLKNPKTNILDSS